MAAFVDSPFTWYTVSREESPCPSVGVFEEPLAVLGVLGGDQRFEQPVEVSLNPFAQHEPVVTGEFGGARQLVRDHESVLALPQDP